MLYRCSGSATTINIVYQWHQMEEQANQDIQLTSHRPKQKAKLPAFSSPTRWSQCQTGSTKYNNRKTKRTSPAASSHKATQRKHSTSSQTSLYRSNTDDLFTMAHSNSILSPYKILLIAQAGLCGSVGCAVRLETRRSRVQPPPRSVTFFRGNWSWNIFYGHSLPSADSRRAVVSFWRKNVQNTG